MADALELHSAQSGDLIRLSVSGMLLNGTRFEASDCIQIIGRPRTHQAGKTCQEDLSDRFL